VPSGRVEGIYLASAPAEATFPVERVEAVEGQGLVGDRKYGAGPRTGKPGRDLTLIEAEAIEGLAEDRGVRIGPGEARRNVVTRGVALNELVGKRFRVGPVECVGVELCEPCTHLESLTKPGVLKGLVHRGGLRADILQGGRIEIGDEVAPHR
jgi:MOSC domain-containing protein YiiM